MVAGELPVFLLCFMNGVRRSGRGHTLRMHQEISPFFGHGANVLKLLMWNEIIEDNMSELSTLKGAETFMSAIQFFWSLT